MPKQKDTLINSAIVVTVLLIVLVTLSFVGVSIPGLPGLQNYQTDCQVRVSNNILFPASLDDVQCSNSKVGLCTPSSSFLFLGIGSDEGIITITTNTGGTGSEDWEVAEGVFDVSDTTFKVKACSSTAPTSVTVHLENQQDGILDTEVVSI